MEFHSETNPSSELLVAHNDSYAFRLLLIGSWGLQAVLWKTRGTAPYT